MSDLSAPEFHPFRSPNLEARIRHIEDQLVALSVSGPRDENLSEGVQATPVPPLLSTIPEENVEFDPADGHDHDGVNSALISGVQFETDFGAIPTRYKTVTVVDAVIEAGHLIIMAQSADAPTGKSQDENEMDPFICRAVAEAGQLVAYLTALEGPVTGVFRFNYRVMQSV